MTESESSLLGRSRAPSELAHARIRVLLFPLDRKARGNPYFRVIHEELVQRYDIVPYAKLLPYQNARILHVHWLEYLLRDRLADRSLSICRWQLLNFRRTVDRIRQGGGALVWTAHNLHPHENFVGDRLLLWHETLAYVLPRIDVALALDPAQIPILKAAFPQVDPTRWRVAVHPHFRGVYASTQDRIHSRRINGLPEDGFIVAMIGLVRPYKRLLEAAIEFQKCARKGEYLLIAGLCKDEALARSLTAFAASNGNIILRLTPLSEAQLVDLYSASDVALFNFGDALNSGSVITALSLGVPVIAPKAVVDQYLSSPINLRWAFPFKEALGSDALRTLMDQVEIPRPEEGPDLEAFSPARAASQHDAAYREAIEFARGRRQ